MFIHIIVTISSNNFGCSLLMPKESIFTSMFQYVFIIGVTNHKLAMGIHISFYFSLKCYKNIHTSKIAGVMNPQQIFHQMQGSCPIINLISW